MAWEKYMGHRRAKGTTKRTVLMVRQKYRRKLRISIDLQTNLTSYLPWQKRLTALPWTPLHRGQTLHLLMKILKGRNCWMPSMQQKKVKPLEGVVYLSKSGNIVAVKLASSLYKQSFALVWENGWRNTRGMGRCHYRASLQEGKQKRLRELSRYFSSLRQNDLGLITYSS